MRFPAVSFSRSEALAARTAPRTYLCTSRLIKTEIAALCSAALPPASKT